MSYVLPRPILTLNAPRMKFRASRGIGIDAVIDMGRVREKQISLHGEGLQSYDYRKRVDNPWLGLL